MIDKATVTRFFVNAYHEDASLDDRQVNEMFAKPLLEDFDRTAQLFAAKIAHVYEKRIADLEFQLQLKTNAVRLAEVMISNLEQSKVDSGE